jgi:hypothetical protein
MTDPEIVVENADAEISESAIESLAALLLSAVDAGTTGEGDH